MVERSLRPQLPEDVRQRQRNEQFGDTEFRWDLDRYLVDNPVARLGYDEAKFRYMGRGPEAGRRYLSPMTYAGERSLVAREKMSPDLVSLYEARFPEDEGMIDPGTILYSDRYAGGRPEVLGHEAMHAGIMALERAGLIPPSGKGFEEAAVEMMDVPFRDEMINPAARFDLEPHPYSDTIQYLDSLSKEDRERVEGYLSDTQRIALEELRRRGEPPRAERRVAPQEEKPSGLAALFNRIFGGD